LVVTESGPGLGPCRGAPHWILTPQNQLLRAVDPEQCLQIAAASDALELGSCAQGVPERQTLLVTDTGQIRARGATCLSREADGVRAVACRNQVNVAG